MNLPNGDNAVVDIEKLRDYCLNPNHLRGRHKARVFASAIGLTAENADELRYAILHAAKSGNARPTEIDGFGSRYVLDFHWNEVGQGPVIRTTWIIRTDEDVPRLISCYVL